MHSVVHHYFDFEKGWDGTNPFWHTVNIQNSNVEKHTEMVKWLYERIDKPERHCRWARFNIGSGFRFRYEKDFLLFRLTWE